VIPHIIPKSLRSSGLGLSFWTRTMKAEHKIRREILRAAQENNPIEFAFGPLETVEQIEAAYELLVEADAHWDYESEVREGEVKTNIPAPSSRHYEADSVAMQTAEGEWIGWTYFFGGGKYGEPGAIDWMSDAYHLNCTEEEKVVVVRIFEVAEDK
jgi:hypothetical protein